MGSGLLVFKVCAVLASGFSHLAMAKGLFTVEYSLMEPMRCRLMEMISMHALRLNLACSLLWLVVLMWGAA